MIVAETFAKRVELSHATAIFTTRSGGVSQPPFDTLNLGANVGDDPAAVAENLARVRHHAGVDRLRTACQVHGSAIVSTTGLGDDEIPEADGLVTDRLREGLLVTVADCLPVALATPTRVAMLHCGWRPLAAGIVERALALLDGEPVEAAIGPGIGHAHYEVGPEVPAAFGEAGARYYSEGRLDLLALVRDKLSAAKRVVAVDECTFSIPDSYFSHRRDGTPTGRQAGVVWRS